MRIAIHQNSKMFNHSTTWDKVWIDYCENNNIKYDVINCYDTDIIEKLKNYDCLLWHFSHYSTHDMMFARTILKSAKQLGLKVFPDTQTSWHFDDKIAETYLLQSINAPLPKSWMLYTLEDCKDWLKLDIGFPVVAKLRNGSGANNVKLLKNKRELLSYAKQMYGRGLKSSPSLLDKTKSNVKTSKDWKTFKKRFKRIPDFLETLNRARKLPKEKGYVYLQQFIPNDGFDLKIVVVGDKLSFLARDVRKGDFRASGGGSLYYDSSLVSKEVIESAFHVSDKLGFQCMGFDYVIDSNTGKAIIIEYSYGFSHTAIMQAGGYWDREGRWHNEPLNAPVEIIKELIN